MDENSESRVRTRYLDEKSENATHEITEYFEEEEDSENRTQEIIEFYEKEEDSESEKRKEYFDTTRIESAASIFMNCRNLKIFNFLLLSMLVKMQMRCLKVVLS